MSRFPAELTVTLIDGKTYTECFNQVAMANFMRQAMLESLRKGEPIAVFDNERIEIEPRRVASIRVIVQEPARV